MADDAMIIWLASYPRSGNTALRILLHNAFGLSTYSLYDDLLDIAPNLAVRNAVGHVNHGLAPNAFKLQAVEASETVLVKTHGPPEDASRAIYVIRDGRSASVSYLHWLERYTPQTPVSLEDVVTGRVTFGSWSAHIDSWMPRTRPGTLLMTYEEVIAPTQDTVAKLAEFIGSPPLDSYVIPSFNDLNTRESGFFRAGSDARNIAELMGDDLDLFWWLHGAAMVDFGYVPTIPKPRSDWNARRAVLESTGRSHADMEALMSALATERASTEALRLRLTDIERKLTEHSQKLAIKTIEADRLRCLLTTLSESGLLRFGHRIGITRALHKIQAELAPSSEGLIDEAEP